MKKRMISVFCALAMVLSFLTGVGGGLVMAADTDEGGTDQWSEQWVSYYSSDFRDASDPLTEVPMDQYWDIGDDGSITRKNAQNLSSDYKHGSDMLTGAFIGLDGTTGKSWKDPAGGTIFWGIEGYLRVRGSVGPDDTTKDWWGKAENRVEGYDQIGWHHMKIEVKNNYVTVMLDGNDLFEQSLDASWYDGGQILLATNVNGTQFRNVSVERPGAQRPAPWGHRRLPAGRPPCQPRRL